VMRWKRVKRRLRTLHVEKRVRLLCRCLWMMLSLVMICLRSKLMEVLRFFRSPAGLLVVPLPLLLLELVAKLLLLLLMELLRIVTLGHRRVRVVRRMRRGRMRLLGVSLLALPLPLMLIAVKMVELLDLHRCHCRAP